MNMKPQSIALAAALALCSGLAACASYGPGAPDGYYDAAGYNAYYDDAYGPFYDGYWDGDDFFFSRGRGRAFERDTDHHFHRTGGAGFHGVHGHFHAPSAHAAPSGRRPG
jgi:hypothetical protein